MQISEDPEPVSIYMSYCFWRPYTYWYMKDQSEYEIMGVIRDDAAGSL